MRSATALRGIGHQVLIEPMLEVVSLATPFPEGDYQGIVLTSSNAIPALDQNWPCEGRSNVPVIVTGNATLDAAKAAGFIAALSVNGSAVDIIKTVPSWIGTNKDIFGSPDSINLLYPGAETLAVDIPGHLASLGIKCTAWPTYQTVDVSELSWEAERVLKQNLIDFTLLYSTRTATNFVHLLRRHALPVERIATISLSRQIAESLPKEMQSLARVSKKPNENSLIKCLIDQPH